MSPDAFSVPAIGAPVGVQDLAGDVGPGVFTGATPCLI
jgi:hypothetical protein